MFKLKGNILSYRYEVEEGSLIFLESPKKPWRYGDLCLGLNDNVSNIITNIIELEEMGINKFYLSFRKGQLCISQRRMSFFDESKGDKIVKIEELYERVIEILEEKRKEYLNY